MSSGCRKCSRSSAGARRRRPAGAIKSILEEGEEILVEYSGSQALDAGLLASAQAVEHYEMSRYGTLKKWTGQLGRGQRP
jgi:ferritin-like metal-binding protein YciE